MSIGKQTGCNLFARITGGEFGGIGSPIVLFYAMPGAMLYFVSGLQWSGYQCFSFAQYGMQQDARTNLGVRYGDAAKKPAAP